MAKKQLRPVHPMKRLCGYREILVSLLSLACRRNLARGIICSTISSQSMTSARVTLIALESAVFDGVAKRNWKSVFGFSLGVSIVNLKNTTPSDDIPREHYRQHCQYRLRGLMYIARGMAHDKGEHAHFQQMVPHY